MFAAAATTALDPTPIVIAVITSATTLAAIVLQQGTRTRRVGRREHRQLLHRVEALIERFDDHLEHDHGKPPRSRKDHVA